VPLEPSTLSPGDVLGRYELLMPIARGGMGQVWAARLHGTRGFQKLVAVKTILPSDEDDGRLESMLFEEASLASLVRHPNVVETLDLGERDDGTMYLALEWVPGEALDYILRVAGVQGLPMPIVVNLGLQALEGLRAVHEACNAAGEPLGIVHRDISLQNLLVTYSGVVKIIDFGIAKATQRMSPPTEDGTLKGKFGYMSPEQLRGDPLDARTDLFGLGIVLYRATTGLHPFKCDNPAATVRSILLEEPQRPGDLVPGYPEALAEVVLKALAKDRSMRFASAREMLVALERSLPQAELATTKKDCEAFLRRLLGERIAEREQALRAALKLADEGRPSLSADGTPLPQRSQSTLRAVSVETAAHDVPAALHRRAEGDTVTAASGDLSRGAQRPSAHNVARRAVALLAGVGILSAIGLVYRQVGSGSAGPVTSMAASPGPAADLSSEPPADRVVLPPPDVDLVALPDPTHPASGEPPPHGPKTVPNAVLARPARPGPEERARGAVPAPSTSAALPQTGAARSKRADPNDSAGAAPTVDPLSRRK
jgi:serine/threonine-protein kinase